MRRGLLRTCPTTPRAAGVVFWEPKRRGEDKDNDNDDGDNVGDATEMKSLEAAEAVAGIGKRAQHADRKVVPGPETDENLARMTSRPAIQVIFKTRRKKDAGRYLPGRPLRGAGTGIPGSKVGSDFPPRSVGKIQSAPLAVWGLVCSPIGGFRIPSLVANGDTEVSQQSWYVPLHPVEAIFTRLHQTWSRMASRYRKRGVKEKLSSLR